MSSAPTGTTFQVYANSTLSWHGFARSTILPAPRSGVRTRYDVGTVDPDEGLEDFSADLDPPPGDGSRVFLEWPGGRYLGIDIVGFYVYASSAPGGAVDYSTILATVPAYVQGFATDGYGQGGYGSGGYGSTGSNYSWTSGPLAGGTWNFAVKPFDAAGNLGTARTQSAVVEAPPNPPARNAAGKRLTYTYNATTHVATLAWLASP